MSVLDVRDQSLISILGLSLLDLSNMRLFTFTAVAGTFNIKNASLEPTAAHLVKRVDCKALNLALTVLKNLGPPATSFCSSYLKVPATRTESVITAVPTT